MKHKDEFEQAQWDAIRAHLSDRSLKDRLLSSPKTFVAALAILCVLIVGAALEVIARL